MGCGMLVALLIPMRRRKSQPGLPCTDLPPLRLVVENSATFPTTLDTSLSLPSSIHGPSSPNSSKQLSTRKKPDSRCRTPRRQRQSSQLVLRPSIQQAHRSVGRPRQRRQSWDSWSAICRHREHTILKTHGTAVWRCLFSSDRGEDETTEMSQQG
ncbi:hypothetical protein LshimejAT787_1102460 [Lyophyllum shimeji]|uniref:Uncharacterized protein n=1 Tax=Lyophyllum shimeji TaxID=47721 RepID=A0A9P3PV45_LYOSH|nr:hypothetical protein LshimejAT787_1102460 [Lyophyllum shimeji]